VAAKAAALPAQHGRRSDDDEGLPPGGPHPGQPDPQEAIALSKSRPIRRSLIDGQLLPQGEVFEGEVAVAAAQEREEPEHVEQEGDHRAGFSPDQSRLINHLASDGVLAKDRRWRPQYTPKQKKRTALLQELKEVFRRSRSQPVEAVIAEINPKLRGWVNYFRIGHASRCLAFVRQWVERKVRRHLMRARNRRGFGWKRWSTAGLYDSLGLFADYRVRYLSRA
jgi:hypothetical protein